MLAHIHIHTHTHTHTHALIILQKAAESAKQDPEAPPLPPAYSPTADETGGNPKPGESELVIIEHYGHRNLQRSPTTRISGDQ